MLLPSLGYFLGKAPFCSFCRLILMHWECLTWTLYKNHEMRQRWGRWGLHHGLESTYYVDWRCPLSCDRSVMMVFSAQLAESRGCTPSPFTPLELFRPFHFISLQNQREISTCTLPTQGCRTGPPGYIGWRAGTTILCQSRLYHPSQWLRIEPLSSDLQDLILPLCTKNLLLWYTVHQFRQGEGHQKAGEVTLNA